MFERESHMKPIVRAWMESKGLTVKEEFPSHVGICDLAGCRLRRAAMAARVREGQLKAIGPLVRVHIWEHIPNDGEHRTVSVAALVSLHHGLLSHERVLQELGRLEQRGFIRRTSAGTYQKVNGWHPLHARLVAVELKLRDWQNALRQAARYFVCVDESYVALPEEQVDVALGADGGALFRKSGVGLLAVTGGGRVRTVMKSYWRRRRTRSERAPVTHAAERFWRDAARGRTA